MRARSAKAVSTATSSPPPSLGCSWMVLSLILPCSMLHPANGERGSYCTDIPFELGSLMHLGEWLLAVADEHRS